MSDTEATDIENISFKKQKNGYTYYGNSLNNTSSSFKLILVVFFISISFLLIGFGVGYYFGFDKLLLSSSSSPRPIPDEYIPNEYIPDPYISDDEENNIGDIDVNIDPFKIFMHEGIRYGGDYGYDTINNPITYYAEEDIQDTRRLLEEGENNNNDNKRDLLKKKQCKNRRCCHPVNGISATEGKQCYNLNLDECCELEAKDICDWNCQRDVENVRKDHIVAPGHKRNKLCYGHSEQNVC